MQIVFFGTPEFAVPTLEALINDKDIKVLAVVTQPDRPSGRGHKLQAPPVKLVCQKYNIPVYQPEKLSKANDVVESLRVLQPDLIIMVAFGQILKKAVLEIPKLGVINLHASLLPAYRGAAPINWAIINGDTVSGITTMFTEVGLDTGPMLLKQEICIDANMNAAELSKELANCGASLTVKTIQLLQAGGLQSQKQDDSKATYAPLLSKELGKIDWSRSAVEIHNLVRGLIPWPLAFTSFRDNIVKIWRTSLVESNELSNLQQNSPKGEPGLISLLNKRLFVCCQNNIWLEIKEIQPANRAKLNAFDWINGLHLQSSEKLV